MDAPTDRLAFLNSTGGWTTPTNTGLNSIDLWIGGLAEKKMPFGGMLGSTFNAVFEPQMENLQDGDRFYYLTRTQGQNFLNMLEQNSFAKMIMANTDLAQPGPDGIRGTADDVVDAPYRRRFLRRLRLRARGRCGQAGGLQSRRIGR